MRRALWLLAFGLLPIVATTPALAAPTYSVSFLDDAVTQSTPFRRDVFLTLPPSNGTGTYTAGGYAGAGFVAITSRVDWLWSSAFSGGGGGSSYSSAQATDFVITGPAGPSTVSGTFHLRAKAAFAKAGGFPAHGGHTADLLFNVFVNGIFVTGAYSHNNFASGGSGVLSGTGGGTFDVPFTVSGTFPVGSAFSVFMFLKSTDFTYGNVDVNPGMVETDAGGEPGDFSGRGLWLDASDGPLMTLPPGYTVNSASWGVVNNQYPSQTGVGDEAPVGDLRLDFAGANPSSGETRVSLALPREGLVRVVLFDAAGRVLNTLMDGWQSAGTHTIVWAGRTSEGVEAPAGLYFLRAEAEGRSVTRRLVRVR
jgi:hypothetical protein